MCQDVTRGDLILAVTSQEETLRCSVHKLQESGAKPELWLFLSSQ